MATRKPAVPAEGPVSELLEKLLPGKSKRARNLRAQILEFCSDLSAKTVLLRGPIGAGKSTVARAIGFVRRVAPLSLEAAKRLIGNVRYDGLGKIDFTVMTWYVELALTGLSDTLAESQLFGVGKRVATGVDEKPGIFELARTGRAGGEDAGAALTGGIVFLDEVGDLPPALQGKLLPVLSGGVFYRMGGEGDTEYEQKFAGVTISASWKELDAATFRGDLLSRITQHVIEVPGLGEREEDLPEIVTKMEEDILARQRAEVERVCGADCEVDRGFWRELAATLRPLTREERMVVLKVDWARYGNMRGLTYALERILLQGGDAHEVVSSLEPISTVPTGTTGGGRALLAALLARRPGRGGFAMHVREIEIEQRRSLRTLLQGDSAARATVIETLKLDKAKLGHQLQQLDRSRRKQRRRAHK
jgi:transcriptional regulator with PAS, ATPase and Fis domain